MSFKSWWKNEHYNREHMQQFRKEHPEWGDHSDGDVATTMVFQAYAASEAFRGLWAEIKRAVTK